jgi:hypothetical protein
MVPQPLQAEADKSALTLTAIKVPAGHFGWAALWVYRGGLRHRRNIDRKGFIAGYKEFFQFTGFCQGFIKSNQRGCPMGAYNYGLGNKDMARAGHNALRDRSGLSFASVATLSARWDAFCAWAKGQGIRRMEGHRMR